MKTIAFLLCLVLVGCGTFSKQEPGVFQPNKLEKVNAHVSKMVPRAAETIKLPKGVPLPPRTDSVKSSTIPVPSNSVAQTNSTMDVPRGLTIIPSERLPIELQEAPESFLHRLVRYSVIWACLLGFGYLIYLSAKKYKMPKDNPFKKKPSTPPSEQLTLKL